MNVYYIIPEFQKLKVKHNFIFYLFVAKCSMAYIYTESILDLLYHIYDLGLQAS